MTDTTHIVFLLFPGITQLDFTAPAQALCRILLQTRVQQRPHQPGHAVTPHVVAHDGRKDVRDRVADERSVPGDHFVQHHAERPDVGAAIDLAALGLFGRHVRRGTDDHAELR